MPESIESKLGRQAWWLQYQLSELDQAQQVYRAALERGDFAGDQLKSLLDATAAVDEGHQELNRLRIEAMGTPKYLDRSRVSRLIARVLEKGNARD